MSIAQEQKIAAKPSVAADAGGHDVTGTYQIADLVGTEAAIDEIFDACTGQPS